MRVIQDEDKTILISERSGDAVLTSTKRNLVRATSVSQIVTSERPTMVGTVAGQKLLESAKIIIIRKEGGADLIDDAVVALDKTFSSEKIMDLINPFALQSFGVSPSLVEMGSTVNVVTLNWTSNKPADTASIAGIGAVPVASPYVLNNAGITNNRSFQLTLTRGADTKQQSASISFQNRVYWGVSEIPELNQSLLVDLSNQLSGSRGRSLTFDCTGGRYFYLAYPARLGAGSFKVGGFTYTDMQETLLDLQNASGFTEQYRVYRSGVIQFGTGISLVVT